MSRYLQSTEILYLKVKGRGIAAPKVIYSLTSRQMHKCDEHEPQIETILFFKKFMEGFKQKLT